MQLVQDLHMRCYRLHLRLVALCQSISLGIPITRKSNSMVTPIIDTLFSYSVAIAISEPLRANVSMVEVEGVEPSSFRFYCQLSSTNILFILYLT